MGFGLNNHRLGAIDQQSQFISGISLPVVALLLFNLACGHLGQAQENAQYQGWLPKTPKVSNGESVRGFFIKLAVTNVDEAVKQLQKNEGSARVIVQTVQSVSESAQVQAKTPIAEFKFKFDPTKVKATTEIVSSSFVLRSDKDIDSPLRIGVYSGHYALGYTPASKYLSIGYSRVW